jgi:hypothetical protein
VHLRLRGSGRPEAVPRRWQHAFARRGRLLSQHRRLCLRYLHQHAAPRPGQSQPRPPTGAPPPARARTLRLPPGSAVSACTVQQPGSVPHPLHRPLPQGARLVVVTNATGAELEAEAAEGANFCEDWRHYLDHPGAPAGPGELRRSAAPLLVHEVLGGGGYSWMLWGTDTTLWFLRNVEELTAALDPDLPWMLTGAWAWVGGFGPVGGGHAPSQQALPICAYKPCGSRTSSHARGRPALPPCRINRRSNRLAASPLAAQTTSAAPPGRALWARCAACPACSKSLAWTWRLCGRCPPASARRAHCAALPRAAQTRRRRGPATRAPRRTRAPVPAPAFCSASACCAGRLLRRWGPACRAARTGVSHWPETPACPPALAAAAAGVALPCLALPAAHHRAASMRR